MSSTSASLGKLARDWAQQEQGIVEVFGPSAIDESFLHEGLEGGWCVLLRRCDWLRRGDKQFRGSTLEDAVRLASSWLADNRETRVH